MSLIPFDIEKAKVGAKVVTRDGLAVRILAYDRIGDQPIVGLRADSASDDAINSWNSDGTFLYNNPSDSDLFLSVEPQYRAWTADEVPVGCLIRDKSSSNFHRHILIGVAAEYEKAVCIGQRGNYSLLRIFETHEYSMDNGKTWQICGVLL